jgi:DNA end-binding protein Ku
MPRAIWKGAISFGLVHVPVALYPATSESGIDFDWLDKRSMDPVGYKRINKRTGREVSKENIVKGVAVEGGEYVVLGEDEIRAAYPKTMQTIEIESFTHATEIPFVHLEAPYYLEPVARGEKVYALLREAMLDAGLIGIARVVMHTKEHLAALIPTERALMLNTLRWATEIRPWKDLSLPPAGRQQVKDAELKMARRLIDDMTEAWKPEAYADKFTDAIQALVEQRAAAGKTEQVQALEDAPAEPSNVIDLTELLSRSLGRGGSRGASAKSSAKASEKASEKAPAAKRGKAGTPAAKAPRSATAKRAAPARKRA